MDTLTESQGFWLLFWLLAFLFQTPLLSFWHLSELVSGDVKCHKGFLPVTSCYKVHKQAWRCVRNLREAVLPITSPCTINHVILHKMMYGSQGSYPSVLCCRALMYVCTMTLPSSSSPAPLSFQIPPGLHPLHVICYSNDKLQTNESWHISINRGLTYNVLIQCQI